MNDTVFNSRYRKRVIKVPAESEGQLTYYNSNTSGSNTAIPGTAGVVGRLNSILCTIATTGAITVWDSSSTTITTVGTTSGTVNQAILCYIPSGTAGQFSAYDIPYKYGLVLGNTAASGILVVYTIG